MTWRRAVPAAVALALLATPARALDLVEATTLAMGRNPELVGQRYNIEGARENVQMAMSRLAPNLRLNMNRMRSNTGRTLLSPLRDLGVEAYTAQRDNLQLVQPLLRMPDFYAIRVAGSRLRAGELALQAQEQLLVARVAQAYFEVLVAAERDRLTATRLQLARTTLAAAEAGVQAGASSRSDIDDARARVDAALAEQVETQALREMAQQGLLALLGPAAQAPEAQDPLLALGEEDLVEDPDLPATAAGWIRLAESANGDLAAFAESVVAADAAVAQARSARLPTLDMVVARNLSTSDSENSIGYRYETTQVGVQLSLPLFTAGGLSAQVRQTVAARGKARADRDAAESRLRQQVTEEFARHQAAAARMRALRSASDSAQRAVEGSEKGIRAGTRNVVDLLDAQARLADARLSLFQARVSRLVSGLRLQALAGRLDMAAVHRVNQVLVASATR
jgi:outer membrane protein, protease secretion system